MQVKVLMLLWICFFTIGCESTLIGPTESCYLNEIEQVSEHSKLKELETILEEAIVQGIPGINALIKNEEGLIIRSAGYADIANDEKMEACHVLKLGSVTKMMMGTVVWKLIEKEELRLDDLIGDYIPEVAEKLENGKEITVKMLVNHTSGIPDIASNIGFNLAVVNNFTKEWKQEEILKFIEDKPATNIPGAKVNYSNTNTLLLSLILEKITGKAHEDLLQAYIFDPLNMDQTFYYNYGATFPSPFLAQGYLDFNNTDKAIQNISNLNPGSGNGFTGVYSTVYDMYLYINALLVQKTLLNASSLEKIFAEFYNSESGTWASSNGAIHSEYRGILSEGIIAYGHAGGDIGYSANLNYFPHNETILAVTFNYGTNLPTKLGDKLNEVRNKLILLAAE